MTTKAVSARLARWAELLSWYNFQITYKPGAKNHAEIRREQDQEDQVARKIALRTQTLLGPEHLNSRIRAELTKENLLTEICQVKTSDLDLIDELLQTNHETPSLQELREKVKLDRNNWTISEGLLKHQERLVVPKDNNL
jgi:hypothetical protein